MNLQLAAGILGAIIHVPLLIGIWRNKIKQSFASYALWSLLDFIAAYAIWKQDGNFWLPLLWGVCSLLVSISLIFKKCFSWSFIEWLVLFLVILCIFIQYNSGSYYAMIASVLSLAIASIPQIKNTWDRPSETSSFVYLIFTISALLSLLGAKSFGIEQILFQLNALVCCLSIYLLSLRKRGKYMF